ncbi:hypothetical protein [Ancylobacter rudongensis]|uniref:hypothetical protein n=1 Tax=Ancylobacter rudongensis TaxID=177413 RepID=UPI000B818315|nr:hypothetical protein [Ancylobacter rudongensis]
MIERRSILLAAAKALVFGPAAAATVPVAIEATSALGSSKHTPPDAVDALVSAFMRCAETNGVTIRLDYGRARLGRVGVGLIEPDDDPRGTKFERVCAAWSMLRSVPGGREGLIAACEAKISGDPIRQKGAVLEGHSLWMV